MACDTFIKIVVKCKSHFTMTQVGESQPFIDELLQNLSSMICDLSEPQVHVIYEAMGHIISSEHEEVAQNRLIDLLMTVPNRVWTEIIEHASTDTNIIFEQEVLHNLVHILKVRACVRACVCEVRICASVAYRIAARLHLSVRFDSCAMCRYKHLALAS